MANQRPEPASNPLMYGGILPQEEMLAIGKRHKKLTIGIPREKQQVEQRVSLTPEAVEVLVGSGHEVILESQAGEGARYTDTDYSECGAFIVDNKKLVLGADVILKVSPLEIKEIELLKGNQVILSSIHLSRQSEEYIRGLMDKKSTAIAIEQIKDEHGCFPVIQSMSAISGISAISIAAELLSNQNNGKGILLGGISASRPPRWLLLGLTR